MGGTRKPARNKSGRRPPSIRWTYKPKTLRKTGAITLEPAFKDALGAKIKPKLPADIKLVHLETGKIISLANALGLAPELKSNNIPVVEAEIAEVNRSKLEPVMKKKIISRLNFLKSALREMFPQ